MIVDTQEKLEQALRFIAENEVLAYDTETTGLNPRKDIIIGFGISNSQMGYYIPIWIWEPTKGSLQATHVQSYAKPVLNALSAKRLIMWNASFDARFTKYNLGVDLLPALHADVLLMKHTCDEEFPFGLKEVATKLWGHDVKKEKEEMQASIKANGGKPTEYYKASLPTLAKYCIQDCMLTMRAYTHYNSELTRQGLGSFYYTDEVLPLYKTVTIPMEEVGVRLDIPKMEHALQCITADIVKTEKSIQAAIAPNLSLFEAWFLNKDYPLQTYTGKQPAWAKKGLTQRQAWERDYPSTYMFNLQSKHHLKKLFFDTLKEEPISRTPTGLPQVNEEFLELMAAKYAWCSELITYNKLQKLKSTYIERMLEESEDGIYYPSFQLHRTTSGRMGSDIQQMPRQIEQGQGNELVRKYNNLIREFIIPRSEYKLCSFDYNQLEPSVFAHVSGDLALQNIFKEGKDFYSEIAIRTEGLRDFSSNKTAPNYLGKIKKEIRQKAKSYALGIPYGLTPYKLKFELNITEDKAEQLVNQYLNAFPDLAAWMTKSKEIAKYKGQISTQAGRIRHMPRAASIFKKYGACIDNDLQLWKAYNQFPDQYEKAKADRREYKNLLNNAINHQIQSLAASIVNRAGIVIAKKLKTEKLKSFLILNVHDEWVLEVHESEIEQVTAMVKYTMENIVKLTVPLITEPQIGDNYAKCK